MANGVDPSIAENPLVLYALLAVGVASIIFGGITKGTTGFGGWLNSLRRIGADSRNADLNAKDQQIKNLAQDLDTERRARKADKDEALLNEAHRDNLLRDHIKWDWEVYNVLVKAGLLDEGNKPPPLH